MTIFIIFWVLCGIIHHGLNFAFFQGKWPELAERDYARDLSDSLIFSLLGPISLLGQFCIAGKESFKYGFKPW